MDNMTIEEAKKVLENTIATVRNSGFSVWGYDDGDIHITKNDVDYDAGNKQHHVCIEGDE